MEKLGLMRNRPARLSRLTPGISAAAMAISLAVATPAYAQTTSTIRGEGAAAGQTVTVTDTVTGRRYSATVQADGTFVIVGLRPSTYRVEGAGQVRDVVVPVGQTVTIGVEPEAGAEPLEGEVVVRGRRDRQEVRTATIGTSVSQAQIENLPQNDRNFLNFAALAPGVTVSPSQGDRRIQAGGVSSENVNVYIDGASFKNQVGFGGVAGQNFSQGNPFPQSAVQEFRVETQNYKAEFEQAGSAIITAITKTGGDEFHGGIFGEVVPKSWFGRPYFDRPGEANNPGFPCDFDTSRTCYRPKPDYERYQYGADLGGPIIPGLLHFFVAYEGTQQTNPSIAVNLGPLVPEAIRAANAGSLANDFKQDLYFGKLTLFASDADTINLSYFRREESDVRDYGDFRIRENGRDIGTSTENAQVEWTHRGDNWLNEFIGSYQTSFTGTPTLTEGPEYRLTAGIGGGEVLIGGANFFQQANDQESYTFRNNVTYTGLDGHVIKGGIRVSRVKLTRIEDAFANGSYVFAAQGFNSFDASTPYRAQISGLPATPLTAKNTQLGLFLQDDWTVDEHWTINFGLRWDYESNNFNNNFVTPDKVATALRNYQPWQAAGIDPEDYITDGTERDPALDNFQPRLGISYDVFGDRDLIFFAGAGRYYDRNIFYLASLERLFLTVRSDVTVNFCDRNAATPDTTIPTCPAGTLPSGTLEWNPAYRDPAALRAAANAGDLSGDIWVIKDKTPTPYTDQFTLGVRKHFGDLQLSAAIAHNRSHDSFIFVRGNRQPDGLYTSNGLTWVRDNFPPEGRPAGYTGRLNIGQSDGEARYTALYLTADKAYTPASGWGATASLTISDAESNQAIAFGEGQMFNAGDQTAFGWQDTRGLERWRFVGTGIVDLPLDFRLAGTLTLSSGPSFGNVDFDRPDEPASCDGGCFYYNDAGVFRPKKDIAYKNLDLRLAKVFDLPGEHEVTFEFEVFNVFDWVNRNYSTWGAGSGSNPPLEENNTVGNARTFQAGLRYRF